MKTPSFSELSRELSVLARAVSFPNLSAAALQIGISQPQLSRIVARIEKALSVVLLDREVRRRAGWTPFAHELVQTYLRGTRHLEVELRRLIENSPVRQLRIGSLEGMFPAAAEIAHRLLNGLQLETLELNVFDLNDLEERFLRGDLDLILSMREPGRRKYTFSRTLGYQTLEEERRPAQSMPARIHSGYEFQSRHSRGKPRDPRQGPDLISNSLSLRRHWLETYGGAGLFPSSTETRSTGAKSENPVLLLGSETLDPSVWKQLLQENPQREESSAVTAAAAPLKKKRS